MVKMDGVRLNAIKGQMDLSIREERQYPLAE